PDLPGGRRQVDRPPNREHLGADHRASGGGPAVWNFPHPIAGNGFLPRRLVAILSALAMRRLSAPINGRQLARNSPSPLSSRPHRLPLSPPIVRSSHSLEFSERNCCLGRYLELESM